MLKTLTVRRAYTACTNNYNFDKFLSRDTFDIIKKSVTVKEVFISHRLLFDLAPIDIICFSWKKECHSNHNHLAVNDSVLCTMTHSSLVRTKTQHTPVLLWRVFYAKQPLTQLNSK